MATRFLHIKYSLTLHAHSETDYPAGFTLGAKIKAANFVMCISHFMRAQAFRTVPQEHHDKIYVYRCGVPIPELTAKPIHKFKKLNGKKTFRFICVARLSEEKGHYGLLQAFHDVVRDNARMNFELVLVGDGPERKNISAKAGELGLANMVTFKGALPESLTQAEIQLADALVLGSFMEGIPVVLMEAMAMAKPVIAPNITGIPELITHNQDGLLFVPTKWSDLADQMLVLIEGSRVSSLGWAGYCALSAKGFEINQAVQPLRQMFLKGTLKSM